MGNFAAEVDATLPHAYTSVQWGNKKQESATTELKSHSSSG